MDAFQWIRCQYQRLQIRKIQYGKVLQSRLGRFWVKWNWYPMKPNAMMKNASDRLWEIPVSKDASLTEGTEWERMMGKALPAYAVNPQFPSPLKSGIPGSGHGDIWSLPNMMDLNSVNIVNSIFGSWISLTQLLQCFQLISAVATIRSNS